MQSTSAILLSVCMLLSSCPFKRSPGRYIMACYSTRGKDVFHWRVCCSFASQVGHDVRHNVYELHRPMHRTGQCMHSTLHVIISCSVLDELYRYVNAVYNSQHLYMLIMNLGSIELLPGTYNTGLSNIHAFAGFKDCYACTGCTQSGSQCATRSWLACCTTLQNSAVRCTMPRALHPSCVLCIA